MAKKFTPHEPVKQPVPQVEGPADLDAIPQELPSAGLRSRAAPPIWWVIYIVDPAKFQASTGITARKGELYAVEPNLDPNWKAAYGGRGLAKQQLTAKPDLRFWRWNERLCQFEPRSFWRRLVYHAGRLMGG